MTQMYIALKCRQEEDTTDYKFFVYKKGLLGSDDEAFKLFLFLQFFEGEKFCTNEFQW